MSIVKRIARSGIKVLGSAIKATPTGQLLTSAAKKLKPILPGAGAVATTVLPAVATIGAGRLAAGRQRAEAATPRRRTSKGISGSQLKAFYRVTRILDKVCKTPAPARRRSTSRSKSCR